MSFVSLCSSARRNSVLDVAGSTSGASSPWSPSLPTKWSSSMWVKTSDRYWFHLLLTISTRCLMHSQAPPLTRISPSGLFFNVKCSIYSSHVSFKRVTCMLWMVSVSRWWPTTVRSGTRSKASAAATCSEWTTTRL